MCRECPLSPALPRMGPHRSATRFGVAPPPATTTLSGPRTYQAPSRPQAFAYMVPQGGPHVLPPAQVHAHLCVHARNAFPLCISTQVLPPPGSLPWLPK